MTQRRVLVFDSDPAFVERVRRSLGPYGFEVEAVDSAEGLTSRLKPKPALALIGVELPEREGFEIFSRTKAVAKGLPIVLVTGSVAPGDMAMHQKLSVHADGYLDKRGLVEKQFLDAIGRLVKLGPRSPAKRPSQEARDKTGGSPAVAAVLRDAGLGPEDSAAIAVLLDEPGRPADSSGKKVSSGAAAQSPEVAKLLATVAGLERKLKAARDTAKGSPFSREFLDLRDQVERQEREILVLKEQASAGVSHVEGTERRLRELTRALLRAGEQSESAVRAAQEAQEARDEAVRQAEQARAAIVQKTQELTGEIAGLRARHAVEIESLQARLQQADEQLARERGERDEWAEHAQASLVAAEQRHAFELGRARESHAAEMKAQSGIQAALRKELDDAAARLATSEERWKTELFEVREENAGDLAALESRHHLAASETDKLHATRMSQLDQELAAARLRIEELVQEQGMQEQRAKAKDAELTAAGLQIEELRRELGAQEQRFGAKDAELTTARQQIGELQRELGGQEHRANLKDAELTEARRYLGDLQRDLGGREQEAQAREAELAAARLQADELRRELRAREQRAREDEATITSLRGLVVDFSDGLLRPDQDKSS
jgi:CheY-like chemotaxis protein